MEINLDAKYYYLVNSDLKMSKGKVAAQVSHVAMMIGEKYNEVGRAVVLKADQKILEEFIQKENVFFIRDAGLTEVPKDSLTCVGFKDSDELKKFVNGLKLL